MKKRKGFSEIVLPGGSFWFTWGHNSNREVVLVLYTPEGRRLVLSLDVWYEVEDSPEYVERAKIKRTWRGDHKKCSQFGGWGRAEVRELYRKYSVLQQYQVACEADAARQDSEEF